MFKQHSDTSVVRCVIFIFRYETVLQHVLLLFCMHCKCLCGVSKVYKIENCYITFWPRSWLEVSRTYWTMTRMWRKILVSHTRYLNHNFSNIRIQSGARKILGPIANLISLIIQATIVFYMLKVATGLQIFLESVP